jgi:hypothetical protein
LRKKEADMGEDDRKKVLEGMRAELEVLKQRWEAIYDKRCLAGDYKHTELYSELIRLTDVLIGGRGHEA